MNLYLIPKRDFYLPLAIALLLMWFSSISGLDLMISSLFYSPQTGWSFQNNFWIQNVLHKGGVKLVILGMIFFIIQLIQTFKKEKISKKFIFYSYSFLVAFISVLFVSFLKKKTTFPCPWSLSNFGGDIIHNPNWLELFSSALPARNCFPGGHSSGALAFLGIIYAYKFVYGSYPLRPVLIFFGISFSFGLTQQIRGAHFLSHDLASLAVVILVSWCMWWCFYKISRWLDEKGKGFVTFL